MHFPSWPNAFLMKTFIDAGKNEIWEQEGGAYITLTLPFAFVSRHSTSEVTQRFLDVYKSFVDGAVDISHISVL